MSLQKKVYIAKLPSQILKTSTDKLRRSDSHHLTHSAAHLPFHFKLFSASYSSFLRPYRPQTCDTKRRDRRACHIIYHAEFRKTFPSTRMPYHSPSSFVPHFYLRPSLIHFFLIMLLPPRSKSGAVCHSCISDPNLNLPSSNSCPHTRTRTFLSPPCVHPNPSPACRDEDVGRTGDIRISIACFIIINT